MPTPTTVAEIRERFARIESEASGIRKLLESLDKRTVLFVVDRMLKCAPLIIVCAPTIDNFGCDVRPIDFDQVKVEDLLMTATSFERWIGDIRRILENAPQDMALPQA